MTAHPDISVVIPARDEIIALGPLVEEIAQALNLTESTVRGRLARARSLVMRQMKEWA